MKISKVTYSDLEVLFKIVAKIGNFIQEEVSTIHPADDIKKIRSVADYDLAKELAKKIASKMMNMEGKKHCSMSLKSYEAVLFTDYIFLCQDVQGYAIVVYEKHIMHMYKDLFTRNIAPKNEH